jgi:hypothetical protein
MPFIFILLIIFAGSVSPLPKDAAAHGHHGPLHVDGQFSTFVEIVENLLAPRHGHLRRSLLEVPPTTTATTTDDHATSKGVSSSSGISSTSSNVPAARGGLIKMLRDLTDMAVERKLAVRCYLVSFLPRRRFTLLTFPLPSNFYANHHHHYQGPPPKVC